MTQSWVAARAVEHRCNGHALGGTNPRRPSPERKTENEFCYRSPLIGGMGKHPVGKFVVVSWTERGAVNIRLLGQFYSDQKPQEITPEAMLMAMTSEEGAAIQHAQLIHYLNREGLLDIETLPSGLVILGGGNLFLDITKNGRILYACPPSMTYGAVPHHMLFEALKPLNRNHGFQVKPLPVTNGCTPDIAGIIAEIHAQRKGKPVKSMEELTAETAWPNTDAGELRCRELGMLTMAKAWEIDNLRRSGDFLLVRMTMAELERLKKEGGMNEGGIRETGKMDCGTDMRVAIPTDIRDSVGRLVAANDMDGPYAQINVSNRGEKESAGLIELVRRELEIRNIEPVILPADTHHRVLVPTAQRDRAVMALERSAGDIY